MSVRTVGTGLAVPKLAESRNGGVVVAEERNKANDKENDNLKVSPAG